MILTMIFMYEKRNQNYFFSIHLIFYRAHQVPQYYEKWSIRHIFLPFHQKRYIISEKK